MTLEANDKKPTVVSKLLCVTECCASLELTSAVAFSCLSGGRRASIASLLISMPRNLIHCPSSFFSFLTRNTRSLQI